MRGKLHSFFISMVYLLLSLSMLRKKPFSASIYAKDMLAYRKQTTCCFMQQPLPFMSMEANVAVWRFLMSSLDKDI